MEPTDYQPVPAPEEPPPLPVWPLRPVRPTLRIPVTILCWVVVGVSAVAFTAASFFGSNLDYMESPAATVIAMGERDLDLNEALVRAPKWEKVVYRIVGYSSEDNQRQVSGAYRRVIDYLDDSMYEIEPPETDASLRARVVVLEAEQGQQGRLDDAIDLLPSTEQGERFIDTVLFAYHGEAPRVEPGEGGWNLSLLESGDARIDQTAWSMNRLRIRLAEREGNEQEAARVREVAATRGQPALRRGRRVEVVFLATVLMGLIVSCWWIPRIRRSVAVADGIVVAPWSAQYGAGVIARGLAAAMVATLGLSALTWLVWWAPLNYIYTLVTFLPILLIMHHYLFRPDGSSLWKGFGMAPGTVSWKGMILFALALTAIDQVGCLVIQHGAEWIGLTSKWEEGLDETILFGSLPMALLSLIDGVVWAPLFEEIVFRGLLYVTLRTRLTPIPAAAISAVLFGIVHPYSLVGFLEVTWTGFILAIAYENCRSLWPCIFAHFFNNLIVFGLLLVVYR